MSIALGMPRIRPSAERALERAADRPDVPGLIDSYGRVATDLRVSLTDRCNLRCTYCMPAEGLPSLADERTMSLPEVVRLVRIAVERLGVRSVRLTGGEPLLRHDLVDVVAALAELRPRPDIALTTNAVGLAPRAAGLAAAGLDRANVSLDSLDPATYAALARRPFLAKALDGIEALRASGVGSIKVNAVLAPGVNDHEAVDLLEWALARDLELRFIEQMPLGADRDWAPSAVVTGARTRALLSERFVLEPDAAPRDGAPAERWIVRRSPEARVLGRVGIIASITEPFCADCTRTRLTADGAVRSCLFSADETPLLELVRRGADDDDIADAWRAAMWVKQPGHGVGSPAFAQPRRTMSAIGG